MPTVPNHPEMVPGFVTMGTQQLNYLSCGQGPGLLLAFPGYGLEATDLCLFAPYLVSTHTCLFFELPFHGSSTWQEQVVIDPAWLPELVKTTLKMFNASKVSLLGYSIGARFCLNMIQDVPELIELVTLLSPDGLWINPYYYFFTRTFLGEMIFRSALTDPGRYFPMATWLNSFNLIDSVQYRYMKRNMNDPEARRLVGLLWPAMRDILPDRAKIAHALAQHNVKLNIFMGKYDQLIPVDAGVDFCKNLNNCTLHVLDKGHRTFDRNNVEMIATTLLSST